MHYRTLGRTGLRVSVLSQGTGGPSMFGQKSGLGHAEQNRLIRGCLDLGINLFDTHEGYADSERILGRALKGVPRDDSCWSLSGRTRGTVIRPAQAEPAVRPRRRVRVRGLESAETESPPLRLRVGPRNVTSGRKSPTPQPWRAATTLLSRRVRATRSPVRAPWPPAPSW